MTDLLLKKFEPSPDYANLLKQAYALHRLAEAYYNSYQRTMKIVQNYNLAQCLISSEEVKAHRYTNTILTNSLLEAEQEIERLRKLINDK